MCDYSLMAIPSRLAVSGDELLVRRFDAKSLGLAAAFDVRPAQEGRNSANGGFWARARTLFHPSSDNAIRTVCIPPGARLLIRDISARLQHECGFREKFAEAVFTQTSADANSFRDAVRFQNGVVVLLQRLDEGRSVRVLDLSPAEEQIIAPNRRQGVTI
jgi:hypothetical protein